MSRTILTAVILLAGAALAAPLAAPPARADDDVAKQLRLLYFDGKFSEAKQLLDGAPPEVRDDVKLRRVLGDVALKFAKRQEGLAKKAGLVAARMNFSAVRVLEPTDAESVELALDATLQLVDLAKEAKNGVDAQAAAGWGITEGEKALEGGADSSEVRLALAKAYAIRAEGGHPIDDFGQIVGDYGRGAALIAAGAESADKPAEAFAEAAQICLDLGAFINEYRPIEEETRDEEAVMQGVAYATRATEQKHASDDIFTLHILALRAAHRIGITEGLPRVYLNELPKKERLGKLDLRVPRSDGWKKQSGTKDWPMLWNRQLGDDDTAVQIMIKEWDHSQVWRSKGWDRLEEIAIGRFESERDKMDAVAGEVAAEQIDATPPEPEDGKKKRKKKKKKGGPEIWHWELSGTDQGRSRRVAEWIWYQQKKDGYSYQMRILDWRKTPDLTEPDLVAFVQQALGLLPPPPEEDGGKKKKRR